MMCIAFAMLGQARTTRQSRGAAVAGAIGLMAAVRGGGFAVSGLVAARPAAVPLVYLLPLATIAVFGAISLGLLKPRAPAALTRLSGDLTERLTRLIAARSAAGGKA